MVARKQVRFLEMGYDGIVAMVHNVLIHEGRLQAGTTLAGEKPPPPSVRLGKISA